MTGADSPAASPARYAVVAVFERLPLGVRIDRAHWPAHVTLVPNFRALAEPETVAVEVHDAGPFAEPLDMELGALALFGPDHDVPVRLVHSASAERAHDRLSDRVETLPGFAADEPHHWRAGYRPHLTLGPKVAAAEGERRRAVQVAIVEIAGRDAQAVALIEAGS